MPCPTRVRVAALMACATFFMAGPEAAATEKKKPSGGFNFSGSATVSPSGTGKKNSGGSTYSGHSGGSSSRNIAAGVGGAMIGYGLSGGIQQAIQNAPKDHRPQSEKMWDRQDMRDDIRSRTPEELKQLRAAAKGRKQQQADAADTRGTLGLFMNWFPPIGD